jgi:subtilisin-like proprotein convertase family protein/sugar lactone lactonase YvrE
LTGSPPTLLLSGPPDVPEFGTYRLNLTATDPENDPISQWTINWGDGAIQTFSGNPSSVTHPYGAGPVARNITASAVVGGETFTANVSGAGAFRDPFVAANSGGLDLAALMTFGPDGSLYVSDRNAHNVLRYDGATGAFLGTFVTAGSGGLNLPGSLLFGADGNLYVTSEGSNSVLRYSGATGSFIDAFVPSGSGGLVAPRATTIGPDGDLYVESGGDFYSPTNRVLRYDDATGAFLGVFSSGLAYFNAMDFGPDGNLYATDWAGDRVQRFNGATGAWIDDFVSPATSGGLDNPSGLAFGPDGDLYVVSIMNAKVMRYDGATGYFSEAITGGGMDGPNDVVFGSDNNLYVSDFETHSVLRYAGPYAATTQTQLPVVVLDVITTTYTNSTAVDIPDAKSKGVPGWIIPGTVTSTITAPNAGKVLDVNVKLNIAHKSVGDLHVLLTSPSGQVNDVVSRVGGDGDNFTNTVLDDEAATPIQSGTAPFTGTYKPSSPLYVHDGTAANGVWQLEVRDVYPITKGKLTNWSVTITRGVGPSALTAGAVSSTTAAAALTAEQARPLLTEALARWQAAGAAVPRFQNIDVQIANLPGATVGMAAGHTIWLDDDAAGWGWFVDRTPWSDSEFTTPGNQGEQGRMDLLTVLMHEMGHVLGLDHEADGVMQETLAAGTRESPTPAFGAVDPYFAASNVPAWADASWYNVVAVLLEQGHKR